jgi:hypothetical protein
LAGQKHTFDGEQVSWEENENELIASVRKQSRPTGPAFEQAVDKLVVFIRLKERSVSGDCD